METLVTNLDGKPYRAVLNGRDCVVAPLVMIVPGVLNGSAGPVLYTAEELGRNPSDWNHMPAVLRHPKVGGKYVSARSPEVLNRYCMGIILQSSFKDVLKARAWFFEDSANRLLPGFTQSLMEGQVYELSTGLGMELTEADRDAVFNGVSYKYNSRGYRPDHLAVLPDERGACGVDDGCGLNVNAKMQLSHDQLRERLCDAVAERFPSQQSGGYEYEGMPGAFVVDVFDKEVVFWKDARYWTLKYKTDLRTGTIQLDATEPVEVQRLTSYKPVANLEKKVDKTQLIDFLVTNCDCWKGEGDRELLNTMSEAKLKQLKDAAEKTNPKPTPAPAPTPAPSPPVAQPVPAEARLTDEERQDLAFARKERNRQRSELVNKILARVPEEDREGYRVKLKDKNIDELTDTLGLIEVNTRIREEELRDQSYGGAGGGPAFPRRKKKSTEDTEVLLPTIMNAEA
jgi:hypothetical protein